MNVFACTPKASARPTIRSESCQDFRPLTQLFATLGKFHCLVIVWAFFISTARADQPLDFAKDVAPIFQQHCVRCHSAGNAKGDVSLATFAHLKENDYVVAGDPDSSYLLELVTASSGEPPAMPQESKPLSDEEVTTLRRWITDGAKWPDDVVVREKSKADASWWAYQPLKVDQLSEPSSPAHDSVIQAATGIDDFIRAKLTEQQLDLNPPADRRTLIRRATYDLLGLPPTPDEVEAFVTDADPEAYEKLIDRLLDSPHYGERWGRHWLDVVRFGESNGFERNVIINDLWPFRDYVIRSLNEDKPFDQFIGEHIAGDVFGKGDPSAAIGTAFLVAGPYDDVGNQDPVQAAQIRANTLDEIIRATSEAFLGMTLGCARCHDHKFDPITQEDYYGLYATFAGIRHGRAPLVTPSERQERNAKVKPLEAKQTELTAELESWTAEVLKRGRSKLAEHRANWTRPMVDRAGTVEEFTPVRAKFVRLICEANDIDPGGKRFRVDEFEVWSAARFSDSGSAQTPDSESQATNVALQSNGGKASGAAREIEDFPDAYGPQHANDGKAGARFISAGPGLTIELLKPTTIDRVVFSSARGEATPEHQKFSFVAEYRIEVSLDGETWTEVANGRDRKPREKTMPGYRRRPGMSAAMSHLDHRLLQVEATADDKKRKAELQCELNVVRGELAKIPPLRQAWIGTRNANDAEGPFHVFLGGSPQKKGDAVVPASLSVFGESVARLSELNRNSLPDSENQATARADASNLPLNQFAYRLDDNAVESERREKLADWIVSSNHPLTPRVLANRLWHYHFGTGIVDTPSDFGYMGGRPTHPELLDFLAVKLKENNWRIKAMHRLIMLSDTYRQSSAFRVEAAKVDGDARFLWRFPPRRLSSEEVRDTMLMVAGKLNAVRLSESSPRTPDSQSQATTTATRTVPDGGPGFRLYQFMQDNVCTYVPLDKHGPETYRRAVYHQNARASVVDLMTEFDQPDCTFSAPKRSETTTPLQALTMLNHSFTFDMAAALAQRLQKEAGDDAEAQIRRAYQLCYSRQPTADELSDCLLLIQEHSLATLCRVLLNTSELIYVR